MSTTLKETLYDTYQKDYNAMRYPSLSYIFRCFNTGDDEEFQLVEGSDNTLQNCYYAAIDSIDDKNKKRVLKEAIGLWYSATHYLIKSVLGDFILDQLKEEIWHHGLLKSDYDIWDSIVCGCDYEEYKESVC